MPFLPDISLIRSAFRVPRSLSPLAECVGVKQHEQDKETRLERLGQLYICKFMRLDGKHPRVLKELVDAPASSLSFVFERSW